MMNHLDIVIVANSPGELSAFARPIARQFKEKSPESRIILFLTPCQYSSGNEVDFAKKNLAVDVVVPKEAYRKWIMGLLTPEIPEFSKDGAVLFLGGDLLHAMLIAKKLNYKAYAYLANKKVSWVSFFSKFFVPDIEPFENKVDPAKLIGVGDLMAEPIPTLSKEEARNKWHLNPDKKIIAMMPGSRLWEIKYLMPLYEKIIDQIKKDSPDVQFMLIISPFTQVKEIEEYKGHHAFDAFAYFDSIKAADLVITIPGTNTAQLAALGIPMVVMFPLDRPEAIPLQGLAHYITMAPILGNLLKRAIAKYVNAKTKFFALPNIKANQEIVPEIRGKIDIKDASGKILALLLNNKALEITSKALLSMMKPSKASVLIVDSILKHFEENK